MILRRSLFVLLLLTCPAAAQTPQSGWFADAKTGCRVWNEAPQSNETISWSGACSKWLAQGRGVLQWLKDRKPTDRYEGEMLDGKLNGRGVYTWATGESYEGEWSDGKPSGSGMYVFSDGRVFSGTWSNGCFKQDSHWVTVATTKEECGFR